VKADLTRKSYDPAKYFSRVLMQQGRVQLDADWNEQAAILLHMIRRLGADLGGPYWTNDGGFIPARLGITPLVTDDVVIPFGSFYVDGILCEIDTTPVPILNWDVGNSTITVAQWTVDDVSFDRLQYLYLYDASGDNASTVTGQITAVHYENMELTLNADISSMLKSTAGRARRLVTYLQQPYWPSPVRLDTAVLLYLDVWERLITSVEDDSIREVALNGADTAARTKVIWQVKTTPAQTCLTPAAIRQLVEGWHRGLLRAQVQPASVTTDPCTTAPDAGYRGAENQLYRVEIHVGGKIGASPSFKWSRENGAVVFPVIAAAVPGTGTTTISLGNLGRDDRFGLAAGDWVEAQDDDLVYTNRAYPLMQVQSIDRTRLQVTLTGSAPKNFGSQPALHPLLRRWDQQAGDPTAGGVVLDADGAVPIPGTVITGVDIAQGWINLEDGVQVRFDEANLATYRRGDYWLIPARVATGNVVWPTELGAAQQLEPVARSPDGVDHHYAPLAIVPQLQGEQQIESCVGQRFVQR